MNPVLAGSLAGAGLSLAVAAGLIAVRAAAKRGSGTMPTLTLACSLAIAAFSLAQLVFAPRLLPMLMRDAALVHSGQPWRLLTSLLVQDGGWPGAGFNLVGLLVVGTIAERLLGRVRWTVVAVVSVAVAQLFALSWQPVGAGNSILDFGLAGAVCVFCLTVRLQPFRFLPISLAFACFGLLLVMRDIHGVAAMAGALVMAMFLLGKRWPGVGTRGLG